LSLANLNIQVKSLRNNCELTEIVLKFQMGYPLADSIVLTQKLEDFMDSIPVLYPEKATFDTRKEVKLMDLRESINMANVKRLKYGYLPTVEAFAGLSTSAQRQNFNFLRFGDQYPWFNVRAMGFAINVPIWDSFRKKAQISSAKLDIERIKIGRDLMLDGFQLEYDRARLNYAQAIDEYNNTLKNLELAKKIYRVAQIKYKEGIGSSLELTTAERELYSTQANVVNAMYKVVVSKVEINRVLGLN
jgi:outer membrane protein